VREETIGDLRVRLTGGADGNGGGKGPFVVLLHGFGAPGDDLVPVAEALHAAPDVRFAFPEAPIDLGPEAMGGRAWWWIDMMQLQRARILGQEIDRTRTVPDGLVEARAKVNALLDEIERRFAPPSIVLGGFSQGAMLACDVALRSTRKIAALALLSGTLIAEQEWEPVAARRAGMRVLQSHGQEDPMLPFGGAMKLREFLTKAGLVVEWIPFRGGHGIPPAALQGLAKLVASATA
jgi:phospholipase/carboxylesterase